jgi:hypothetical protein
MKKQSGNSKATLSRLTWGVLALRHIFSKQMGSNMTQLASFVGEVPVI